MRFYFALVNDAGKSAEQGRTRSAYGRQGQFWCYIRYNTCTMRPRVLTRTFLLLWAVTLAQAKSGFDVQYERHYHIFKRVNQFAPTIRSTR